MVDLEKIQARIKQLKEDQLSDEEKTYALQQMIPPREKIIEVPQKIDEKKKQRNDEYYLLRKKIKELEAKGNKKQQILQEKIQRGLKRTYFYCYSCKKPVYVDPKENKYELEFKRGVDKNKLLIINACPSCAKQVKAFSCWLDLEISHFKPIITENRGHV
jgi:hypothetical protein